METHEQDPKPEGEEDSWETVTAEFRGLGHRLRDSYRRVADERGPTDDEVRDALGTLAGAWSQVAESVGGALRDAQVRQSLKQAVSAFATAIGSTISELGTELRSDELSSEEE